MNLYTMDYLFIIIIIILLFLFIQFVVIGPIRIIFMDIYADNRYALQYLNCIMYSYTVTNINRIHPADPHEPQLRIRCKCLRDLIQQQIYTCISCTGYCCHYCTIPDIILFQCRNCNQVSESNRSNKCKMCFSCPYCANVLTVSRSQDKKFMMWCQYCYWTTREIDICADKSQDLIQALNKLSSNLKGNQEKIYNTTQGLFKQISTIVDYQNQASRYGSGSRKPYKKNQEDSLIDTKNQIQKTCEALIKRGGLDDTSEQYDGQLKLPQNLPLQAKKTRRCPSCRRPLTTAYRSPRTGQQRTQLMYKQLKILQCQVKPAINGMVKIKCLRNLTINNQIQCKQSQVKQVKANEPFKVKVQIVNRTRETTSQVEYDFIVLFS